MGVYDEINVADETHLDPSFTTRFQDQLQLGTRGYGYWVWKPQIVLQTLARCQPGDILQYTDAGCHLNPAGRDRLLDYFAAADTSPTGILAFAYEAPQEPLRYDGRKLFDWPNKHWIKGDLLDHLNVRHDAAILDHQMIASGIFFIKKTPFAIGLIKQWLKVMADNFHLIDDSPSISENIPGFKEHRHDQAVFSLLCRIHGIPYLSGYEHFYPSKDSFAPDWKALRDFPIHAKRDKDFGLLNLFLHKATSISTKLEPSLPALKKLRSSIRKRLRNR